MLPIGAILFVLLGVYKSLWLMRMGLGMAHAFKRMLVGTSVGRAAMAVRNAYQFWQLPRVEYGTVVNDQIAIQLAVGLCPPTGTFIDIGAHIGSVISEVHYRHPHAQIIAFEAIPEKAAALQRKFPGFEVHNLALCDREGEASFFIDIEHSASSSLARGKADAREIKVKTRRLDSLFADRGANVLKVDVEGAELGVFRGATELISRSRPIIMFESGPGVIFDFTKEAMFAFLSNQNYAIFAPNRLAHTGGRMTLDAFLDSHEYPRRTTNYFALPVEREAQIREAARSLKF